MPAKTLPPRADAQRSESSEARSADLPEGNSGYERFRKAIHDGTLIAGMTVTQNELCKILGLSLTPLRETLVLLEEHGLVETKPRSGIQIVYPEVEFIRENFQFRKIIELPAVRAFADSVTAEWIGTMRKRHEDLAGIVSGGSLEEGVAGIEILDRDFHYDIVRALGNRSITLAHRNQFENIFMARRVHQRPTVRKHILETLDEHMEVIAALEKGDSDLADEALERHFRGATHRVFGS